MAINIIDVEKFDLYAAVSMNLFIILFGLMLIEISGQ